MIRCRYESLDCNRNEKHMAVLGYSPGVSEEELPACGIGMKGIQSKRIRRREEK